MAAQHAGNQRHDVLDAPVRLRGVVDRRDADRTRRGGFGRIDGDRRSRHLHGLDHGLDLEFDIDPHRGLLGGHADDVALPAQAGRRPRDEVAALGQALETINAERIGLRREGAASRCVRGGFVQGNRMQFHARSGHAVVLALVAGDVGLPRDGVPGILRRYGER